MRRMSLFTLACGFMSVFASMASAAEWVHYDTQDHPRLTKRYYDKASISRTKENYVRVSGMGSTTVGSSTALYEIDCKGRRMRGLNTKTYEKPMAEGKIEYQSKTALSFNPLAEAAEFDPHKAILFKIICETTKK